MANPIVKGTISFTPDPAKNYFLTCVIGNGQAGNSAYTDFEGNQQAADKNAPLGAGSSLKGKSLVVASEVMQVNPDNLNLVVTYYITDEPVDDPATEPEAGSADQDAAASQTILFVTTIKFQ